MKSLDPRITRAPIEETSGAEPLKVLSHWPTYEIFHQKKRGTHHVHVGTVHAPDAEMAILFGKEQYGRRGTCVNMWAVASADIFATDYEDSDIFETTPDKTYRDPSEYKVMDKIKAYKERQNG